MLQEARELQLNAVADLVEKTEALDVITFKAPTGSGKTFMMADMMDRLLEQDDSIVFLVSTLSKGGLARQNYDAFMSYKEQGRFSHLNPYLINTETSGEEGVFIPQDKNVYVLPRDLYKKGGRLMQGSMEVFLRDITGKFSVADVYKGKQIYLIKDECHQATNNLDSLSDAYFSRVYNFSATPKLSRRQKPDVEIFDHDAVLAHLIKSVEWGDKDTTLDEALDKYLELKAVYENKLHQVPCFIIQISNAKEADKQWSEVIEPALTRHDITYMYIVDKDKDCKTNSRYKDKPVSVWKQEVRKPTSPVEVVIFKLAISEGWDIPRACMLYQIRGTQSKQLDEQVLGRVRRNPILLDFEKYDEEAQELASTAWVWGMKTSDNQSEYVAVRVADECVQEELRLKTTVLKDCAHDSTMFDVDSVLQNVEDVLAPKSIFELYKKLNSASNDIQALVREYCTTTEKWFRFVESIPLISKEYNKVVSDYEQNMSVYTDEDGNPILVSVPVETGFVTTTEQIRLRSSIWQRIDDKDKFSFDSKAEADFAYELSEIARDCAKKIGKSVYLWGKNYPGGDIHYAYYSGGNRLSYPDFIMKDVFDRIHIFEVKSVNEGGRFTGIQREEYENKVCELKRAYQYASKLTNQIFYLPVKTGNNWQITKYENGEQSMITIDQLIDFLEMESH